MRARSMNMEQILRGSKTLNPRRAKSTLVQGSRDKDHMEIDLQAVPELISEHFWFVYCIFVGLTNRV